MANMVRMTICFPSFMEEENNENLMGGISLDELKEAVMSLQRHKSPDLDVFPLEFFIAFFGLLEQDVLTVVEDSRINCKTLVVFNSTFITLIPKSNYPYSLDKFKPISLCNCIYRIIAKWCLFELNLSREMCLTVWETNT